MRRHHAGEEKKEVAITRRPAETTLQHISPLTRIEREMLTTLSDMERWFEDALHRPFFGFHHLPMANLLGEKRGGDFMPSVDMFEEGSELVVRAELAGIKQEDIKVELSGNTLTLSGEKKGEEKVERKDYYRVEQMYGTFSRTLEIPEGFNCDEVKATYKDGLLEIRMPKTAEVRQSRSVPISG